MRIFVYGTLLHGERNHHLLAGETLIGATRTVSGFELRDFGPYPAMVRGGSGSVRGEVYEISDATLERLDDLEGHPDWYRREMIRLANGEEVAAYLMTPEQVANQACIDSGDWRRRDAG